MTISGRLLGLDHGLARIGVAVSDPTGFLARELTIITRKSKREDFEKINRLAAEHAVIAFVIGIPGDLDAPEDKFTQADKVRNWVNAFAETTMLPIILWDEHMTTVDAAEIARRKGRKVRDHVDDLAARVMLQSYLDAVRDGLAPPPTAP
ncbi:MAG: Holliday junction resolvase RuvX [Anaerolinea sp.]|nr:Holliday junction resolvase RuvX [Anaerolinea sp.]